MEPQGCQIEPRDFPKHPLGNRVEQIRKLVVKFDKNQMPEIIKQMIAKNIEFDAKGVLKPKPMLTLIKSQYGNHVFLKGKTMQIRLKYKHI